MGMGNSDADHTDKIRLRPAPLNVWVSRAAWLEFKAANHSKVVFRWRSNAARGPEEAMDGRMADLRREIRIQPEKAGRSTPSARSAPSWRKP